MSWSLPSIPALVWFLAVGGSLPLGAKLGPCYSNGSPATAGPGQWPQLRVVMHLYEADARPGVLLQRGERPVLPSLH